MSPHVHRRHRSLFRIACINVPSLFSFGGDGKRPGKSDQRPIRRRLSASHREGVVPVRERRHLRSARALVAIRAEGMERQAARGAQADALPAMLCGKEKTDAGDFGVGDRGSYATVADAADQRVETTATTQTMSLRQERDNQTGSKGIGNIHR
jgi:hypothetical protein